MSKSEWWEATQFGFILALGAAVFWNIWNMFAGSVPAYCAWSGLCMSRSWDMVGVFLLVMLVAGYGWLVDRIAGVKRFALMRVVYAHFELLAISTATGATAWILLFLASFIRWGMLEAASGALIAAAAIAFPICWAAYSGRLHGWREWASALLAVPWGLLLGASFVAGVINRGLTFAFVAWFVILAFDLLTTSGFVILFVLLSPAGRRRTATS